MATQILDTELDVARKNLHFFQRELYRERFTIRYTLNSELMISVILKRIKYWRMRYNAAMAIEQEREEKYLCPRCKANDHDWCQSVKEGEYY